jgi:hypothetical protein
MLFHDVDVYSFYNLTKYETMKRGVAICFVVVLNVLSILIKLIVDALCNLDYF